MISRLLKKVSNTKVSTIVTLSLSKYDLNDSHFDIPLRGMKAMVEYHRLSVTVAGSKNSFPQPVRQSTVH